MTLTFNDQRKVLGDWLRLFNIRGLTLIPPPVRIRDVYDLQLLAKTVQGNVRGHRAVQLHPGDNRGWASEKGKVEQRSENKNKANHRKTDNPEKMHFILFVVPLTATSFVGEDHINRGGST